MVLFCRQPYPAKPHGFSIGAVLAPDLSASIDTTVEYTLLILLISTCIVTVRNIVKILIVRLVPFNQPSIVASPSSSPVPR